MTTETCPTTGKRRLDESRAKADARWWRRNWLARMNAYHCRACGGWHVGNSRARKPRRVRR